LTFTGCISIESQKVINQNERWHIKILAVIFFCYIICNNEEFFLINLSSRQSMKHTQEIDIEGKTPKQIFREWVEIVVIAILLTLIFRTYAVQSYRIPNPSMENTILRGDFLLGDKITYQFRPPQRSELVIFEYPLNPHKKFIKRCVGIAGDTVVVRNKVLYINGEPFPDIAGTKYTDPQVLSALYSTRDNCGPLIIPRDYIFVIGDNRDISQDSRFWGALPLRNVVGRPLFVYFSWRPDPGAPEWSSLFSVLTIFFYNIIHFPSRVRWERMWKSVK